MALIILDGFGHSEDSEGNAIAAARMPNWDRLSAQYASGLMYTSGEEVGLPAGQMGNSEVGHLNLGSGRIVYQDFTRIGQAIADGSFAANPALTEALDTAAKTGSTAHIMGLLSPGGVHSHEDHIFALLRLAAERGVRSLNVHAILDGRDTPPRSAQPSLERLEAVLAETGCGRIATVAGRFFSMDRDKRWDRIERSYRLYAQGQSELQYATAAEALAAAYERDEGDEFVQPCQIGAAAPFADGDVVLFANFRADRARQITQTFVDPQFDGFKTAPLQLASFVCMTQYHADFDTPVAYPPESLPNTLGEYVSDLGLRQLRIAETEKYAHVTFFFNGGEETPFPGEDRELIPSPRVKTYDLQPQMHAPELTDKLVAAIEGGSYDLIICNFANADMVGHTGNFPATVTAIETLDECLGRISAALEASGGEMLVTADHGNAEQMSDPHTEQAHTAHTVNPVPLLYQGRSASIRDGGSLRDIAPTLLSLMGLPIPAEMTGTPVVELRAQDAA